jgi:HAD superfamily hydrolase (TIGR01450 family)
MKGTVVCDLDGVVYLGSTPTAGAREALIALENAGFALFFATNNSAREPAAVVAKLADVVGYRASEDQIITSALAAAGLIEEGPVLIMGERGVEAAVTARGFETTDDPLAARTVVVGIDRALSYDRVAVAAAAVRAGARLIVTNRDSTFPTEDRLLPGAGACAAPVEVAAGVTGETAGKPSAAMRAEIERRHPDGPIWMIGDRAETDLALAAGPRWRSILVLTGVTPSAEGVEPVPDLVAPDLAGAVRAILRE